MTHAERCIHEAAQSVCTTAYVEAPKEHEVTVTFTFLGDFVKFMRKNDCTYAFLYKIECTKEDFYITRNLIDNYSRELSDIEQIEIAHYNEIVSKTNYTIPIEAGAFVVVGGMIYRYRELINPFAIKYKMRPPWEMLDYIANGGKIC